MRTLIYLYTLLLFFLFMGLACQSNPSGTEKEKKQNTADQTPESEAKQEPVVPQKKAFMLDTEKSALNWSRAYALANVEKTVKILKKDVKVTVDNFEANSNGNILFAKGSEWVLVDGNFEKAKILVDMKSIKSPVLNEQNVLEEGSPEYLNVGQFPTAELLIEKITPEKKPPHTHIAQGQLTIKGKTLPVSFPLSIDQAPDGSKINVKAFLNINGQDWNLSTPKNAQVKKDFWAFDLMLDWLPAPTQN